MRRRARMMAFAVTLVGCFGCGSSDSADAPTDMDEMVARVEQQRASAAAGSPSTNETGAAKTPVQPDTGVQPPTPAVDPGLASKRGFDLEDWSNEAAYVLVKADAAKTVEQLAGEWKGMVLKDVFGKPADAESGQAVVYQLAGHPWSIFACDNSQLETLMPVLSRQADVLVFWNSDFNGWAGIELYRGGQEVEAIHWGLAEDGLGDDADPSKWHARGEVTEVYDGIDFKHAFLFRSQLRKVTLAELNKGEAFVDEFMRHHDAYLPDADQMPWVDYDSNNSITSPLGAGAFTAVHAVEVASPE